MDDTGVLPLRCAVGALRYRDGRSGQIGLTATAGFTLESSYAPTSMRRSDAGPTLFDFDIRQWRLHLGGVFGFRIF